MQKIENSFNAYIFVNFIHSDLFNFIYITHDRFDSIFDEKYSDIIYYTFYNMYTLISFKTLICLKQNIDRKRHFKEVCTYIYLVLNF